MKFYALLAAIAALTLSACGKSSRATSPDIGLPAGPHGELVQISIAREPVAYGTVWFEWHGAAISKVITPDMSPAEIYRGLAQGGYLAFDSVTGATGSKHRTTWHFFGDPRFLRFGTSGVGIDVEVQW